MKSCRTYISSVLTVCLIIIPLLSYAQRSRTDEPEPDEMLQAEADAIAAAEYDASLTLWFSMGCLCIYVGVGAAYLFVPSPGHERLVGKPMEYVWAYTESYKSKRRSLQTRYAIYGCLTTTVVTALMVVILELQEE